MVSNVAKRKPKARPLAKRAKAPSVGQSAIAGLREGLAHLRGEQVPGLVVRKPVDVAAVRKGTGLSQDKFAAEFGLAVAAVRAWEQNLRTPDLAAQTLLRVIESYPDAVRRAVRAA
ncbi:MAG: transcriptional regulator [Hyphomonadaceae bacterium]|jgi:putative transcriptional regulator|nr:transcriptional regulator [Hyphomonadaceae bacterium]